MLDNWMQRCGERLAALPRKSFALFFAYMAERLLPLYLAFENKHQWGDSAALTRRLDLIWGAMGEQPTAIPRSVLESLETLMPSGEEFDSPDSTYAQDAVVCVDAALRALMPGELLDGSWLEYAVEPVKTKVSIACSGYSAVEDAAAVEWEANLMAHPELAAYLKDCENLITRLEVAPPDANEIRAEAHSKQLRATEYIR